jgi:glycine oxidase
MSQLLVVGGGLIGLLSAMELTDRGHKVTVLERGETGRESSWAGGGILSPIYPWRYSAEVNELALWSSEYYPQLVKRVIAATGQDPELYHSGLLILDPEQLAPASAWAEQHQQSSQMLSADDVAAMEPNLRSSVAQAIHFPNIGQVRNPFLVKALRAYVASIGVEIVTDAEVLDFEQQDGRINALKTAKGDFRADAYVIASGAWSGLLLDKLGLQAPIRPVKGQMLLYRIAPQHFGNIVLYQGKYIIPRQDGHVLVGSTMEDVGFDKQLTDDAAAELGGFAQGLIPALNEQALVKQWAGLRPASPDGIPMIGAVPELDNLYINAGHYRNGVCMGPATAHMLADIVSGNRPIFAPDAYLPSNFF